MKTRHKIMFGILIGVVFVLSFILIYILNSNEINKTDSKNNKEEKITERIYYLNDLKHEYIKLKKDMKYELVYNITSTIEERTFASKEGTYSYQGDVIILDNKYVAHKLNGNLVLNTKAVTGEEEEIAYYNKISNTVYFPSNKVEDQVDLIFNEAKKSIYGPGRENGFAEIEEINILNYEFNCFYKDPSISIITCSIRYSIKTTNYTKEKCKNDGSINSYTISSGECEDEYLTNWGFFDFKVKDGKYKFSMRYTGL